VLNIQTVLSAKHRSEPVPSYEVPPLHQPNTVTTFGSGWDRSSGGCQERNREPEYIQYLTVWSNNMDRLPMSCRLLCWKLLKQG